MINKMLVSSIIFSISVSLAQAGVYKWTDEQGNVHYGDKPDGAASQELRLKQSTPNSGVGTDGSRRLHQQRLLESMTRERKQKEQVKAKEKQAQAQAEQQCKRAKQRLAMIRQAGGVYSLNEQGERVVYNDEQRTQATAKAQAAVKKYCK